MEKIALVTGASRGIGQETALRLWQEGCRVVINYRSSEKEALAFEKDLNALRPGSAMALPADVSKGEEVAAMAAQLRERWGEPEILVNNAGIAGTSLLTETTEEDWDRIFAVNVKGMFLVTRAFLPAMIRRRRGKIVNISSIWGQVGASCEVAYSASKGAVIAFTKALAQEVGPSGIQVNCVAPGVIDTQMNAALSPEDLEALREETPLGVIGKASDVAEAVAFLASGRADFITGQVLGTNGGMVR